MPAKRFQVLVIDEYRRQLGIASHPCGWDDAWDISNELTADEERHCYAAGVKRTRWYPVVDVEASHAG